MKLHLPLSLRAALVSVVAALSAAPSHAAVTQWALDTWTGYSDGSVAVGPSNAIYQRGTNQTWDTSWAYIVSVDAANLTDDLTLMAVDRLSSDGNHHYSEGVTLTKDEADGSLKLHLTTFSSDVPSTTSVSFAGKTNVTFVLSRDASRSSGNLFISAYDSNDFTNALYTINCATNQSFSNNIVGGVSFGGLVNYSGDGQTSFPDEPKSYGITNAGYSMGSLVSASDLQSYYGAKTLKWNDPASGKWEGAVWRDRDGNSQTSSSNDVIIFDTADASVTLAAATEANSLTVQENTTIALAGNSLDAHLLSVADGKTFALTGEGTATIADLTGGTVNVNVSTLRVTNSISNTTLTVGNSGSVTANSIFGSTISLGQGATLTLSGTKLENTTVTNVDGATGATTSLAGNARVNLKGAVTLGSVVNNMTGRDAYAFVGGSDVTLTITGTADLTPNHAMIGLGQGKLIVAKGGSLTMARLYNSSSSNAKVEAAGKLVMQSGGSQNYMHYLKVEATGDVVSGSEQARANLFVHNQVEVKEGGKLKAATLRIASTDNAATNLGGTVDVTSLQLDKGTAYISGEVTAGKVADSGADKTGVYSADPQTSTGTLTIKGDADASTGSTLSGNFTVVKQGASTQNFNGSGNERFTGSLKAEGGTLNLANMDSGTRSLQSIHVENGATLGLYRGAVNGTVVTVAAGSLASGTGGGTLNANVVMNNASELVLGSTLTLGGSLTLDGSLLSGALFKSLYQGVTSITLFTGVTSLTIGNPTSAIATLAAGETFSPVTFDGFRDFTDAELAAAFRNNFDPDVFHMSYTADDGGSIIMTANVPEPTTATLSLLALAGLCARRRRK